MCIRDRHVEDGVEHGRERARFVRVAHVADHRAVEILAEFLDVDILEGRAQAQQRFGDLVGCLLYTSPSPRDRTRSPMPSSA